MIYVTDSGDGLNDKIPKSAEDTKIASKVTTTGDSEKLQNDLDRLVKLGTKMINEF